MHNSCIVLNTSTCLVYKSQNLDDTSTHPDMSEIQYQSNSGMFRAGKHDEWKKTWQRDDAKGMKNGWMQRGMQNAGIWKKNNEWIHRESMDESIFYSSVNVPWIALLCSFAAGKHDEWKEDMKEAWYKMDEKWMPTGILNERWVKMNERINRWTKALFIHPFSTSADKGVWVRDGNIMCVSSLRASREIGRESRESRVFSLRFSCRAMEFFASFRWWFFSGVMEVFVSF
jgi:hypothetical protein